MMSKIWISNMAQNNLKVPTVELIVFFVAIFFFLAGLIFVLMLFVSRVVKSHYQKKENVLRLQFQKILNKIIVNEMFSEKGSPNAAFEFYAAELRFLTGNSKFSKQLLISQIMEIKKSLTGNSSAALVRMYYEMELYKESLRELKKGEWQNKARAIRELAEMNFQGAVPLMKKFLYSKNETLHEETLMALVRLEDKRLSFLNFYKSDLSLWKRINIYHYLRTIDPYTLPVFSQYFDHPNISVRMFAIEMAQQFKQTASLPGLVEMLYSDHAGIVGLAVSALGEMEAFQYRREIIRLALHVWQYNNLSKRVIKCLGSIGDGETDVPLIGRFLDHPCYSVRYETVSTLKKLGAGGENFLQTFNLLNNGKINGMLHHFSEPLLT